LIAAGIALAAPLVARFEGKSNAPYWDPVRIRTVCRGHTGHIAERLHSDAECDALFRDDLAAHAAGVLRCTPGTAARPEILAAETSLAFNIGTAAFCRSTAARRFNAGDLAGGCRAIGAYVYAGGRKLPGLVRRRAAEVALCLEGVGARANPPGPQNAGLAETPLAAGGRQ
jgi:lysozyme